MTELGIAIVGCGAIVQNNHLPALARAPGCRAAWFVDPDLDRARELGQGADAGWSADIEGIPAGIDAALVAVPNHLHAEVSAALVRRGLHVMCEKPMAISVAQGEEILAAVEATGKCFAVGHQLRYLSSILELRRLLAEADLGPMQHVDLALGWRFAWRSRTDFYLRQELAGGGVMTDLGCHVLDLAAWLFGGIRQARMTALIPPAGGARMDLGATVQLEFDSGLPATLRASRMSHLENAVTVRCANGFVRASLEGADVTLKVDGSALCRGRGGVRLQAAATDPHQELWTRFRAAAMDGDDAGELCDARAGLDCVRLLATLYDNHIEQRDP